jgi:hypothetical protein
MERNANLATPYVNKPLVYISKQATLKLLQQEVSPQIYL